MSGNGIEKKSSLRGRTILDQEKHEILLSEHRQHNVSPSQKTAMPRWRSKGKEKSSIALMCTWIVDHQIGMPFRQHCFAFDTDLPSQASHSISSPRYLQSISCFPPPDIIQPSSTEYPTTIQVRPDSLLVGTTSSLSFTGSSFSLGCEHS